MAEKHEIRLRLPLDVPKHIERRKRKADAFAMAVKKKHLRSLTRVNKRRAAIRGPVRARKIVVRYNASGMGDWWDFLTILEPGRVYRSDQFLELPDEDGCDWPPSVVSRAMAWQRLHLGFLEQVGPNPAPSTRDVMFRLTPAGTHWREVVIRRRRSGEWIPTYKLAISAFKRGGLMAMEDLKPEDVPARYILRAKERRLALSAYMVGRKHSVPPGELLFRSEHLAGAAVSN